MKINDLCVGVAIMCLWGFNFSVIKLGVDQIDPLLLTALRFSLAAVPAVFFVARPNVPWRYLVAYGSVFGVGVWGIVTLSIDWGVSAGMAGLLLQLCVVFSLVLGWVLLKENMAPQKIYGALLALSGLGVSLFLNDGSVTMAGICLCLVGAFSWSLTAIIVKKAATKDVFAFSVWGMLFTPLPLFFMAYVLHGAEVFIALPEQLNTRAVFSILFQAYPTTLLGYWLWNRLMVNYPLSVVAPLTLLVPVFALLGSMIFYSESVGFLKIIACGLILAGLMVGQWQAKFSAEIHVYLKRFLFLPAKDAGNQ